MGFLQNLMQAPAPGSRGAAFGAAMGDMAPLLFAMAKGLGEGKGASTYAPSGLAAMMLQQQTEADRKMRQEDRDYSRSQDSRMWDWRESGRAREDAAMAREDALRRQAGDDLASVLGYNATGVSDPAQAAFARLQDAWGSPLNVNSAYRSPEHNAAVGGADKSEHMNGNAFDIDVSGMPQDQRIQLIADARRAGFRGVGVYNNALHFDVGAPRAWGYDYHSGTLPDWAKAVATGPIAGIPEGNPQAEAGRPRLSPERAAAILSNPYASEAARNLVLAQFMPQEEDRTTLRQNVEWLMAQGMPFDQALQTAKGGQTINVGPGGPNMGAIPAGHVVVEDPNAPGGYRTVPMQGTEAAREADLAATKAAQREDTQETSGDVVLNAGMRALEASKDRIATGALGSIAAFNPGSDNAEVYRQVAVLRATARIETLNEMKRNSPTGSALGAVSDSEGIVLEAKAGALDPASPNFERDLGDYMRTLLRTIHGKKAGDAMFEQAWPGSGGIKGVEANRGYGRGGAQASPAPPQPGIVGMDGQPVSDEAVRLLKENPTPEYRAFFDEVFGKGVAEQVLGQ